MFNVHFTVRRYVLKLSSALVCCYLHIPHPYWWLIGHWENGSVSAESFFHLYCFFASCTLKLCCLVCAHLGLPCLLRILATLLLCDTLFVPGAYPLFFSVCLKLSVPPQASAWRFPMQLLCLPMFLYPKGGGHIFLTFSQPLLGMKIGCESTSSIRHTLEVRWGLSIVLLRLLD
jgi:hypothetical protein